jgi:mannobiose 2-epimerase
MTHQADARHGGWFARVSEDGSTVIDAHKADAWKAGYHDGRALIEVIERLRAMAARAG